MRHGHVLVIPHPAYSFFDRYDRISISDALLFASSASSLTHLQKENAAYIHACRASSISQLLARNTMCKKCPKRTILLLLSYKALRRRNQSISATKQRSSPCHAITSARRTL